MIKTDTIIQRMHDEIVRAQHVQTDPEHLRKHIENVQLLCEVMLADDQTEQGGHAPSAAPQTAHELTEQEVKAMLVGQKTQANRVKNQQYQAAETEEEDASDSLFDF